MIDLKSIEEKYLRKVTEISGDGTYISFGGESGVNISVNDGNIVVNQIEVNDYIWCNKRLFMLNEGIKFNNNIESNYGSDWDYYIGYNSSKNKFRFGVGIDCAVDANVAFEIDVSKNCTAKYDLTVDGALKYSAWRSKEIFLDENEANVQGKPTRVNRGLFRGYSMTEYAVGEELLFRMRIPHSWDGTTNPYFVAISLLSAAEDVNDKYKFQIEWQSADVGGIIPDTTQETLTDEITVSNGSAFRGEILSFELDATTMVAGQNLQIRLRRIAASASSVTNEIIILHWDSRWKMNKLGTESIQGY